MASRSMIVVAVVAVLGLVAGGAALATAMQSRNASNNGAFQANSGLNGGYSNAIGNSGGFAGNNGASGSSMRSRRPLPPPDSSDVARAFAQAVASYVGLSVDALWSRVQQGQTLAQVARAQGKSVDGLKTVIVDHFSDTVLGSNAGLSNAEKAQILDHFRSAVDGIVNGQGLPGRPGGRFDHSGMGPPSGYGPPSGAGSFGPPSGSGLS